MRAIGTIGYASAATIVLAVPCAAGLLPVGWLIVFAVGAGLVRWVATRNTLQLTRAQAEAVELALDGEIRVLAGDPDPAVRMGAYRRDLENVADRVGTLIGGRYG